MAQFIKAWDISKNHAGGYVNDPNDAGGETYRDIARNFHPDSLVFKVIDKLKQTQSLKKGYKSELLDRSAQDFYIKEYWNKILGDKIKDQQTANIIFDNTLGGLGRTASIIRRILFSTFKIDTGTKQSFDIDLINKINSVNQKDFFNELKQARIARLRFSAGDLPTSNKWYQFLRKWNNKSDEAKNIANSRYLKGWLNRANDWNYSGGKDYGTSNSKVIPILQIFAGIGGGYVLEKTLK